MGRVTERFKYGTKEIIATVSGCFLMVCVRWLESYLLKAGVIDEQILDWVMLKLLVVAITAVFFGPISGCITGLGGQLLIGVIFGGDISYDVLLVLGFYGFVMGLYFGKMHYDRKNYTMRTFVDFNAVQIMLGIICLLFLIPMSDFMIKDMDLNDGVVTGAKRLVGSILVIGTICPAIMMTVSAVTGSLGGGRKA